MPASGKVSPSRWWKVYGTGRGGKGFVVVDGHEYWEYDGFLRGAYFVFDRPDAFHTLAPRGDEIFGSMWKSRSRSRMAEQSRPMRS